MTVMNAIMSQQTPGATIEESEINYESLFLSNNLDATLRQVKGANSDLLSALWLNQNDKVLVKPGTDQTDAYAVQNAAGTELFAVDTSTPKVKMATNLVIYEAVNDANPEIRLGAVDAEELHVQVVYDAGAQTVDYVLFQTDVASVTANKGLFRFNVDGSAILDIDDGGIDLASAKALSITGTDVLDATTLGSGVLTSSLTTIGTIGTGVWQGTVVVVTYGGTGLATITDGGIMLGSGTAAITPTARPTAAQILIGQSAGDPTLALLSGDVTMVATGAITISSLAVEAGMIAGSAVTYAKIQNVSVTDRLLGRSTAGAGVVEEIACTAAGRALIDDATAAAQLVTLGLTATAAEINAPLAGATTTLAEFQQLQTIGATTISANQWIALGSFAETLTGAEVNILDGVTGVTAAELSYIGDVTSLIQAQIDLKAPLANPTFTGSFTSPGIDDNADAVAITIDSGEQVGVGIPGPEKTLHVSESGTGLVFPLKVANPSAAIADAAGILFSYGSGADRGKAAIVYEGTATWNRGDLKFLMSSAGDTVNVALTDVVFTIENDGDVKCGAGFSIAGVTPQAQQTTIVDADGTLADITTKFNTLLADLEGFGFLASA